MGKSTSAGDGGGDGVWPQPGPGGLKFESPGRRSPSPTPCRSSKHSGSGRVRRQAHWQASLVTAITDNRITGTIIIAHPPGGRGPPSRGISPYAGGQASKPEPAAGRVGRSRAGGIVTSRSLRLRGGQPESPRPGRRAAGGGRPGTHPPWHCQTDSAYALSGPAGGHGLGAYSLSRSAGESVQG